MEQSIRFSIPFSTQKSRVDRKPLLSYDESRAREGTSFNLCIVKCKLVLSRVFHQRNYCFNLCIVKCK